MAGDCPAASVLLAFTEATTGAPFSRAPAHQAAAGGRVTRVAGGNACCVCMSFTPTLQGRGPPNGERPSFAAEPRAAAAKQGRELHRCAIHPRRWPGRVREGGTALPIRQRKLADGDAVGGVGTTPGDRAANPQGLQRCALVLPVRGHGLHRGQPGASRLRGGVKYTLFSSCHPSHQPTLLTGSDRRLPSSSLGGPG